MTEGMSTIHFGFTAAPVHVRTARLVAASAAQVAGLTGETLGEVRQAAGEACSRAVARHRRHGVDRPVQMKLAIGESFVTEVVDFAPVTRSTLLTGNSEAVELTQDAADEDVLTEEVALTLLAGLVTDLQVTAADTDTGTIVRMAWRL